MLKLTGAKVLDKTAQREIGGGGPFTHCSQSGSMCCQQIRSNGHRICEAGICLSGGMCLWY